MLIISSPTVLGKSKVQWDSSLAALLLDLLLRVWHRGGVHGNDLRSPLPCGDKLLPHF